MVEISGEAMEDLKGFDLEVREKLLDEIEERLENDRDQENISYINKPEFGIEFQRLKLTENDLNHRVYFDYEDSELVVFAVRHRNYAYSTRDLGEVERRLGNIDRD
ncbi:MAG: type II toxin-antitoxin system RelE/ParE family toxin [Candidatus Nanohaloarchaea archaeon]